MANANFDMVVLFGLIREDKGKQEIGQKTAT